MTTDQATSYGTLYVVATPIGNCDDMSLRAIATLKSVDFILAEDTRHSLILLNAYQIKKPLRSHHAFNEAAQVESVLSALQEGKSAALISDAGTPLIADPGFPLIREARKRLIPVVPIPGPCALITALSAAGVPCETFLFLGFLPAKQTARRNKVQALQTCDHTVIVYESTHRILESLHDLADIFGLDYEMVLAKELTKTFEHFVCGSVQTILDWLAADPNHHKGEFVLILPPKPGETTQTEITSMLHVLLKELSLKQAVKIATAITGLPKNAVYEMALQLSQIKSKDN